MAAMSHSVCFAQTVGRPSTRSMIIGDNWSPKFGLPSRWR